MKAKTTKRALLFSALAVFLCVSMLIGTTYAWFSDSVTSNGNVITSGTLNIDLGIKTSADADYVSVKNNPNKKAFDYQLWEPGYLEWVNLKVSTTGDLALKYTLSIVANGQVSELADVIDVYTDDSEVAADRALTGLVKVGTLRDFITGYITIEGELVPGAADANGITASGVYTVALKMQEEAGNEYQGKSIGTDFSIRVIATQLTHEADSIDDQYDDAAELPEIPVISVSTVNAQGAVSFASATAPVDNEQTTVAITDVDAAADTTLKLTVTTQDFESASTNTNFTVQNDQTAVAGIDLTLTDSNGTEVTFDNGTATIVTYIIPGLDAANVNVKYNGTEAQPTDVVYDPATGRLEFKTTHFSEYYVTYTGTWYYVPSLDRAYTDYDDLDNALLLIAKNALGDDIAKLNLTDIAAFYQSEYNITDANSALFHYFESGATYVSYDSIPTSFNDKWLANADEDLTYVAEGVTVSDIEELAITYLRAYFAVTNYVSYPTPEPGTISGTGAGVKMPPYGSSFGGGGFPGGGPSIPGFGPGNP